VFKYAYNDSDFYNNSLPHNRVPHSKHDNYIEAIIAAIYKDRGFDYCKKWLLSFLQKYSDEFQLIDNAD
ncbi:MAG: hypothetical protein K2N53_06155, partial [Clostridia bacterium]|nr:hypothetical protein [Clostridia bacterium]